MHTRQTRILAQNSGLVVSNGKTRKAKNLKIFMHPRQPKILA